MAVRRPASSDAVVLALSGELDVSRAAEAEAAVRAAARRGRRVIVDLASVEFLDCAALGGLLRARQAVRDAGGDVLLANPRRPLVRRLLALTGLAGTPFVLTERPRPAATSWPPIAARHG